MADQDLLKYSKDPTQFQPQYLDAWADKPIEKDGWVLSHNALRGEVSELQKVLQALVPDKKMEEWHVTSFQPIWAYHFHHVKKHHEAEEAILQPFLETRIRYPEKVSGGHPELDRKVADLNEIVAELKAGMTITHFQTAFDDYAKLLLAHFEEEEKLGLVLMRSYFTPQEFAPVGAKMGQTAGGDGAFVYYLGEDKMRNEIMPANGIPFFVWYIAFKGELQKYKQTVIRHVDAIVAGEPPVEETSYCTVM